MNIRRLIEWIAFAASSTVILYASFAAFDYVLGTGLDNCGHAREAPVTSERGVRAEAMARFCDLIGLPNEKRLGLHLSDDSGDSVLVFYEPRNDPDTPVLRWLDDDHVSVDLGEVTWLTPQIHHLGRVTISKLVVRFKPKEMPALHWLDGEHLQADLGQVTSISPQIDQVGPIHITFTYGGTDPSLV